MAANRMNTPTPDYNGFEVQLVTVSVQFNL